MNKTFAILSAVLLAGSALAQTPGGPVLSAGLVGAQGDAQDMTHQAWSGYGLQAGYRFQPAGYGTAFTPYASYVVLPSKDAAAAPTWSLKGLSAGVDLDYPLGRGFEVFTGPVATSWSVNGSTWDPASGTFQLGQKTAQNDTGLKFGWRLGANLPLGRAWDLSLGYTQSQWRSKNTLPYQAGWNPSRPAFYTVLVNYHF